MVRLRLNFSKRPLCVLASAAALQCLAVSDAGAFPSLWPRAKDPEKGQAKDQGKDKSEGLAKDQGPAQSKAGAKTQGDGQSRDGAPSQAGDLGTAPGNDLAKHQGKDKNKDQGKDEGEDQGRDLGKELGKNRGKDRGNEQGKDQGKDRGNEQGKDQGNEPGKDQGNELVKDQGKDPAGQNLSSGPTGQNQQSGAAGASGAAELRGNVALPVEFVPATIGRDPMAVYRGSGISPVEERKIRQLAQDFEGLQRVRVKLLANLLDDMRQFELQTDPDPKAVMAKQDEINKLTDTMANERVKLLLSIRDIMSFEEKQRLVETLQRSRP